MFINKNNKKPSILITLLKSMSFNAKEWIKIDHSEVRYNKTVADFILGLHDVLKVPRCIVNTLVPWVNNTPLALSKHHVTLETVNN